MAKRLALKARLKRLEQRQLRKPLKRTIIMGITGRDNADVVGISDGKVHLIRQANEPLEAFTRRAAAVTGSKVLLLNYGGPGAAPERAGELEQQSGPTSA